ncbi:MAG: excinuclease ABC subunit UvrB [bacterium]
MAKFKLTSKYKPAGDQKNAIAKLTQGLRSGTKHQTLLGVTGSGKTFTMANLIANVQKPTLVIAHNKTLAAQLYSEFKMLFPENSVCYFVSYYDYYQPEAYVPKRDLYIEKEADINETIERYRSVATQSLLTRSDTIIIASVSCIYGLGDPEDYLALSRNLHVSESYKREILIRQLSDMQYVRSEYDFYPGLFRVRGDNLEIFLFQEEHALRIEFFGDQIESLKIINPITGEVISKPDQHSIFPAKQFVTPFEKLKQAMPQITKDLVDEVANFKAQNNLIAAHRLEQRVKYDLEMLQETGYCSGIENYSRYISNRDPGSPPSTLLDYFPNDWLLFVDESHITLPQVRGMYNGDRSRKTTLIEYGFRLKAALDNRPLQFAEFNNYIHQAIYVSATPDEYEIQLSKASIQPDTGHTGVVEQVIRPTGLLDPQVDIRPIAPESLINLRKEIKKNNYKTMTYFSKKSTNLNQIDDLLGEIQKTITKGQRVLVTTLTKRMAEDLTDFLHNLDIKVQYIHSDVETVERVEILRDLRLGKYDVLVGINLLREGLDLPEVSLVAILDADKEGFLRSKTSLTQTMGRASRHLEGRVIMYANHITQSMKIAIDITLARRAVQHKYNIEHQIRPTGIFKDIDEQLIREAHESNKEKLVPTIENFKQQVEAFPAMQKIQQKELLNELEIQMNIFADMLEFEKAAEIRDLMKNIKK